MSRDPFCQAPGAKANQPIERRAAERASDYREVDRGLSKTGAQEAASRCLSTQTCTWCEVCQMICPDLCITRDPHTGQILIDMDHCKGCGLCAFYCPKGAIRMELESGE